VKRCLYCGAHHERRWACCCTEHTRKMASWRCACTAGQNRARRRVLEAIHKRERNRQRWRDISMGRDVQLHLREVFGVEFAA